MSQHPKFVTRRYLLAAAAVIVATVLVLLFWRYLVGAGVIVVGYRTVTRHIRRRRPRSSWSSLGRTASIMFAAWNSRWLKPTSPVVAKVHAAAGAEHAPCGECGQEIPF